MNSLLLLMALALPSEETRPLTRDTGAPVSDNLNSKTAGVGGPVLLEDVELLEKLARFDRERIPERVVHARGVGALGYFESYGDFSELTAAAPFQGEGKRTPVLVRFSSVIHSKGSPELLRDPRGFATKFFTEDGNWDLVGNNLPVFFIRDAKQFPDMVHSLKPSPITNRQDPNRFFDFFSFKPESTHMLTQLYSDLGTPRSLREMDGFGVHAFKFVSIDGGWRYVKFHWVSQQGVHSLTAGEAAAAHFNALTDDLYASIARGEFPSWELRVQVLDPARLDDFDFNPLDATKIWPEIPEMPLGRMVLNGLPSNFFEEVEQAAFAPAVLIPGIEPSEDRLLQGRLFSYVDTQRHRLGGNYLTLPINRPRGRVVNNNQDGALDARRENSDVNYFPSRRESARMVAARALAPVSVSLAGSTQRQPIEKTADFMQAGDLYRSFDEHMRANLISNLAGDLGQVESSEIRKIMTAYFFAADAEYGRRLAEALELDPAEIRSMAARGRALAN